MQLTEREKNIYNCFLKHFRNGEPFKPRKNFDDISISVLTDIKKVTRLLEKFDYINWDEFFGSTRKLNPDEKCPNLNFFTTRSAIKYYNLFKKQQENRNPESQIEDIKKSLHHIGMFCLKNKINLNDYINHKTNLMYSWVKDYQEYKINLYCILDLGDITGQLSKLSEDEKELYANEIFKTVSNAKMRYHNNQTIKTLIKESHKKIETFLKKHLQENKNNANL
jgi:hypothetical protein